VLALITFGPVYLHAVSEHHTGQVTSILFWLGVNQFFDYAETSRREGPYKYHYLAIFTDNLIGHILSGYSLLEEKKYGSLTGQ
jgi:hypothetical protein